MSRIKYYQDICEVCYGQLVEVFTEELAVPFSEVRFGGKNPMHEVSTGIFCKGCGLKYQRLPSETLEWIKEIEDQIAAKKLKTKQEEAKTASKIAEIRNSCKKIPPFSELCGKLQDK